MRSDTPFAVSDATVGAIRAARGYIFDMDGTLLLGDRAGHGYSVLPGAVELLNLLRRRQIAYRVFTNGSARAPEAYARQLREAGLDVQDAEMMTPTVVAAQWFRDKGISRVRLMADPGAETPLTASGIRVFSSAQADEKVEAIYAAWFRTLQFQDIETAYRDINNGAVLTSSSNVPFFASRDGRSIGSSFAVNTLLRAYTGARSIVLGKPAKLAFAFARRSMKLSNVPARQFAIVGDDPRLEMRMANLVGGIPIAVATGINSRDELEARRGPERCALALTSLDQLIEVLN